MGSRFLNCGLARNRCHAIKISKMSISRLLSQLANAFPIYVLTAGLLALFQPEWFAWFATVRVASQSLIVWGLALIMLGMGLTLTLDDFRKVFVLPKAAAIGVTAQYLVMPTTGWLIATALNLPTAFAVGLILTACCPGGTASNIVAFLARANVALSVLMTLCSTFAAIVLTPLLTSALAGHLAPVDTWAIFWDTLRVIVIPIGLGLAIKHGAPKLAAKIEPGAPLAAALVVAMICASIVAVSAETIWLNLGILTLAVFLLHLLGFGFGYGLAKILRLNPIACRTISIEVGMQNSGLAVFLARQHFADPLTAAPGAISSVMHSVIGSILAGIWRRKAAQEAINEKR